MELRTTAQSSPLVRAKVAAAKLTAAKLTAKVGMQGVQMELPTVMVAVTAATKLTAKVGMQGVQMELQTVMVAVTMAPLPAALLLQRLMPLVRLSQLPVPREIKEVEINKKGVDPEMGETEEVNKAVNKAVKKAVNKEVNKETSKEIRNSSDVVPSSSTSRERASKAGRT